MNERRVYGSGGFRYTLSGAHVRVLERRASLFAIPGGGKTTRPRRGHLRLVRSQVSGPS